MSDTPEKTDSRAVLIFDGHCKLCRAGVGRLAWFDWLHQFRYVSLHDAEVRENYPDLTYDMLMAEMYLVTPSGQRLAGARAFQHISWRIPVMWPIAPILNIPGSLGLWSSLYKIVARNRYRFGRIQECDGGTCHLHFGGKPSTVVNRAAGAAQAKNPTAF